jgi:hypothetical protein
MAYNKIMHAHARMFSLGQYPIDLRSRHRWFSFILELPCLFVSEGLEANETEQVIDCRIVWYCKKERRIRKRKRLHKCGRTTLVRKIWYQYPWRSKTIYKIGYLWVPKWLCALFSHRSTC